jgi:DNA-binding transcriptional ArsR family regulator
VVEHAAEATVARMPESPGRALSDPTRRRILERLAGRPASIGELAEPFGLTLNGVKKHVGILEEVDLVVTAKVGRARECQLGPAQLEYRVRR